MSHSRRNAWKGCCYMCAVGKGKVRGKPQLRAHVPDLRTIGGPKAIKYGVYDR